MDDPPMARLRRRFLERCAGDLRDFEVMEAEGLAASRPAMAGMAHALAGAGGTFGFPAVSAAASRLEALLTDETAADPRAVAEAREALVAELRRALAGEN